MNAYRFAISVAIVVTLETLLITSALAEETQKSEEELWNDTAASYTYLKEQLITAENCVKSQEIFAACLDTLNELLNRSRLVLLPGNLSLENTSEISPPVSFGPLMVRGLTDFEATDKYRREWARLVRRTTHEGYAKLFEMASDVSFEAIFALIDTKLEDMKPIDAAGLIEFFFQSYYQDPHLSIRPAALFEREMKEDETSFVGIGASIEKLDDGVLVVDTFEGSGAEAAGALSGDIITHIENVDIVAEKLSINEVVKRLRGEPGTTVVVSIRRKSQILKLTIERKKVVIKNLTAKTLKAGVITIGYFKIGNFEKENLCRLFADQIRNFENQRVDSYIIDLRGNPGGLLTQAICTGSLLFGKKIVVSTRTVDTGEELTRYEGKEEQLTDKPIITLVNSGSASASEILSGALQDYERSFILGERTFGKGSVQSVQPAELFFILLMARMAKNKDNIESADNLVLRLQAQLSGVMFAKTTARFFLPSGRTNQVVGVEPDIAVYRKPNPTADEIESVIREETLYSIPVLPNMGPSWQDVRSHEWQNKTQLMKSCMEQNDSLKNPASDYQLQAALVASQCVSQLEKSGSPDESWLKDIADWFRSIF